MKKIARFSLMLLLISLNSLTIVSGSLTTMGPFGTPAVSILDFQVFPDPNTNAGPFLPTGDRVSWGYVASSLVYGNGAHRAWSLSDMGSGVRVAVLDTGVDLSITDLAGRVVEHSDFTGEGDFDGNGHGTAMISILASNIDGQGIAGVAPQTLVYSGKVLNSLGNGQDSWIAAGIDWAISRGVQIISMSLGGPCSLQPLTTASVQRALSAQILVVASAANQGGPSYPSTSSVLCPAANPGVVAVSSSGEVRGIKPSPDGWTIDDTDLRTEISRFSSRGTGVSIASPGRLILTWWRGSLRLVSGTSPAAPQVAGLAALMLKRYGEYANFVSRLPQIGRNEFSFKNATDTFYGYGLINATDALTPKGDINGDLRVDDIDAGIVQAAFDSTAGDARYKPAADQDFDGDVDIVDAATVAYYYGHNTLVVRPTSVWDVDNIKFTGVTSSDLRTYSVSRYAFSGSPDTLTFQITYTNPNVWAFIDKRSTTLTLTIRYPDTGSSLAVNLLKKPTLTFDATSHWYYELSLTTKGLVNVDATVTGWKMASSSSFGYSYEIPIFVTTVCTGTICQN